jgi:hypothetical protein
VRGGGFDVAVPAGRTARIVLKRLGRLTFFCRFHPQMTGVIAVLPRVSAAAAAPRFRRATAGRP